MSGSPGKNIAIRSEVVELLNREKRPEESYSDLILRVFKGRKSLRDVLPLLHRFDGEDTSGLDRRLRRIRRDGNRLNQPLR